MFADPGAAGLVVGAMVLLSGAHGSGPDPLTRPCGRRGVWWLTLGGVVRLARTMHQKWRVFAGVKSLSGFGRADEGGVCGRPLLHDGVVLVILHPSDENFDPSGGGTMVSFFS